MAKALFFDIDGTLMDTFGKHDATIPQSTVNELHRLQGEGYKIFIASGRPLGFLSEAITGVGFDGYVLFNGGYVEIGGKPVSERRMGFKAACLTAEVLDGLHAQYMIEARDTIYIEKKPDVVYMGNEINDFLKNVTLFAFDSFEITREARAGLNRVVDWMNEYPNLTAKVEGHTDSVGDDDYNQKLSENRAKAIYDYLVEKGIDASRLSYEGFGETRPVASNDTVEGRAQNRRIEMVFSAPEVKKN